MRTIWHDIRDAILTILLAFTLGFAVFFCFTDALLSLYQTGN